MAGLLGDTHWASMANALYGPKRRKIFVSYHHGGDQAYYDAFSKAFHDEWESVFDNSLERRIDSDNTAYVMQRIRDSYITGTSCSVVLIGGRTHERKYVDWEIKATLDKEHGLVGVVLPTHVKTMSGDIVVPDRFARNVRTGYANWLHWEQLTANSLENAVERAVITPKGQIDNPRDMKTRNG